MNKDFIYKRRLLKLADFLTTVPEDRFDYSQFVGCEWQGKPDLSCGTSACAFGFATTIPSFRRLGLRLAQLKWKVMPILLEDMNSTDIEYPYKYTQKAAAKIFGLTADETDWIFLPRYSRDFRQGDGPSVDASAKDIAEHIREFVKEKYS